MNVSVVSGDRRVDISIDGDSTTKLAKVEAAAVRIFAATESTKQSDKPYGFSLVSDISGPAA